jgi:SagB-type dehydrogenase family enzyme
MKTLNSLLIIILLSFFLLLRAGAQEAKKIILPQPQTEIGKPLMQCLKLRQSSRNFSTKPIELQDLSNLLWAANGINRTESGKRTAPSAMNNQETDIFLAMADGVYLYNPKEHALYPVISDDIRALTGKQDFVKTAPLNLIYVADYSKMGKAEEESKMLYSGADVGFIAQNVYLYCASQGLAVVVRAMIDKPALAKKLSLTKDQKIILSQTVGYPKE